MSACIWGGGGKRIEGKQERYKRRERKEKERVMENEKMKEDKLRLRGETGGRGREEEGMGGECVPFTKERWK